MKLADEVIDALSVVPEFHDKNSPLYGVMDWLRSMAVEIKASRLSAKDVELLQVVRGVLSVDIEDSESHRDATKNVFPQFSDMCQGSVDDYKAADALLVRLIASAALDN